MTIQELEIAIIERCQNLNLKQKAFESLVTILSEKSSDKVFFGDFETTEIKTIFERFEYQIERFDGEAIITTRIGLYIEDTKGIWVHKNEPIGYYELETDFDGTVIDDWLVVEK